MTIGEAADRLHSLLSTCLASRQTPASVLVVGPSRHSLLSQVLDRVAKGDPSTSVIRLDGRIHGTRQIDPASLLPRPTGSATRQAGKRTSSYAFVVLDVFDRWAANPLQQPFLYQLLNGEHRLCVIGLAQRSDALECLEKRVRSRHSQIVIYAPLSGTAAESIEANPASSYWQEVDELGALCTSNELLVLVLVKRILERRHPAGSLGTDALQSFALSAVHEEYTLVMSRVVGSGLLVKPVSRNALKLAFEGLLLKRLVVPVDANGNDVYAVYRLDRLLRSMITDIVSRQARNGAESLHQLLTRF